MTDLSACDEIRIGTERLDALYLGSNLIWQLAAGATRTKNTPAADVLIAGHSSLEFGSAVSYAWTGAQLDDFGQSAKEIWDKPTSLVRDADYDILIASTTDDIFGGGVALPDSSQGLETLQHLYWFGLTAKNKGAEFAIYQSPSARNNDRDATNRERMIYYRQWLATHLDMPVWLIHSDLYVIEMRNYQTDDEIFADGDNVHLNYSGAGYGLEYLIYTFLTGNIPPSLPGDRVVYADAAMVAAQAAWWTGLGGADYETGLVMADPLPSPLPLPSDPVPDDVIAAGALADLTLTVDTPRADLDIRGDFTHADGWSFAPAVPGVSMAGGIFSFDESLLVEASATTITVTGTSSAGGASANSAFDLTVEAASVPGPAVDLYWTAADGYTGPVLTGTQPTVSGSLLQFDGTGLYTNTLTVTTDLYFGGMMRITASSTGTNSMCFFGGDGNNIFVDPYLGVALNSLNLEMQAYLLAGNGTFRALGALVVGDWRWVEFWITGGVLTMWDGTAYVTHTIGADWTTTSGFNLGSTGVATEAVLIAAAADVPDAAGRASIKAAAEALVP